MLLEILSKYLLKAKYNTLLAIMLKNRPPANPSQDFFGDMLGRILVLQTFYQLNKRKNQKSMLEQTLKELWMD